MSKAFSMTFNDFAAEVLKKLGVHEAGEPVEPDEALSLLTAYNIMIKGWSVKGIDIPWRETVTLFVSQGQQSYLIGPTGDHATTAYIETTLSSRMLAGATSLPLTDDTGFNAYDHVGVRMDNGVIHWSTFGGVDMMTEGLASVASSGNAVYAYTTKADRPQRIITAFRRDTQDVPLTLIGEVEYQSLSRKGQIGFPNQLFYRQTIGNGTLFVWPTGATKIVLITQCVIDTITDLSDDLPFPPEWFETMVLNLASSKAPDFGSLSAKDQLTLERRAAMALNDLLDYDVENASVMVSLER